MDTNATRIDWQWNVQWSPHYAHSEAVHKLLELLAEGLVLEASGIPTGGSHPHSDAYAVQRTCEQLQASNATFRADRDAQNQIYGFHAGRRVRSLKERAVKAVAEAFEREIAAAAATENA